MKGKSKALGMGLNALIPEKKKSEDITHKSEVISTNLESPPPEVLSQNSEERTSNLEDISPKLEEIPSNVQVLSYNLEVLRNAVSEASKNPRISLWLPRSAAVLRYLRKTQPEFSISEEASALLDEAIRQKYPELLDEIERLERHS
jgi:hypothetical protein